MKTIGDVAAFLGVEVQTVKQWRTTRNDPMPGEPGRWPLPEITRWRLRRAERPFDDVARSERALKHEALQLDLEDKKLEHARKRDALVEREPLLNWLRETFGRIRARLEALPDEIARSLPPEVAGEVRADVRHRVRLVLREFESWAEEV